MPPVVHKPLIWLLDDSKTETEAIRSVLAPTCRVSTFTDGTALVEALLHQPQPELMVLDWEVPGMSGIEVCEYLRIHPTTATLPILLLTVHQETEDVVRGLEAGANDYVFKPFRPAELAARVHALAWWDQLRKQALSDERARRVLAENALVTVQAAEARAKRMEAERTHLLERERRARGELEALEAKTRQRAEFDRQLVGIVSHDLRNPLGAITLTASALKRQITEERRQRGLQRILQSAERATRMIHDLLDFTQVQHGDGIPIQPQTANLHELLRTVVDETQAARPERSIEVVQTGDGAGQWDPDRLAQVISNLLSNAIQYSPPGTPVRVENHGEENAVVLKVHNTGPPIPQDVFPRLFEPMERGPQSAENPGRSIGLGLYIVRHLVQAHGGSVDVHSTAAEGTTFTVRLPRHPPAQQG